MRGFQGKNRSWKDSVRGAEAVRESVPVSGAIERRRDILVEAREYAGRSLFSGSTKPKIKSTAMPTKFRLVAKFGKLIRVQIRRKR